MSFAEMDKDPMFPFHAMKLLVVLTVILLVSLGTLAKVLVELVQRLLTLLLSWCRWLLILLLCWCRRPLILCWILLILFCCPSMLRTVLPVFMTVDDVHRVVLVLSI